jgi:hypothetical protein
MAALEIEYEDRIYLLDLEDMEIEHVRAMERFGIASLKALEERFAEGDLNAILVYYWLCLVQNGEPAARLERVRCRPIKFVKAMGVAAKKAAKAAESEDNEDDN